MTQIEQILNQKLQQLSDLSIQLSETLEDIINEKYELDNQDSQNYSDIQKYFQEQQKKSQTISIKKLQIASKVTQSANIPIQINRDTRIKQTVLKPELQQKNMSYVALSNVSKLFDTTDRKAKGVGVPTCISCTNSKFLAIGTSLGNVALFQVGVRDYKILETVEILKYGQVMTVNISKDNKYLICGYQNGFITIWDLSYFSLAKTIPSNSSISIVKLHFWKSTFDEFIMMDLDGNVFLYTIQKYIWITIKNKRLLNKTAGVAYHDLRTGKLQNGKQLAAFVSLDFILLITLEPVIEIIKKIQRPAEIGNNKIPNIQIGKIKIRADIKDIILVSWGRAIYIYEYEYINRSNPFKLINTYQAQNPIYNMQMLSQNMLLFIDNNNNFKVINVNQLSETNKNIIKNQRKIDEDLMSQKLCKDKEQFHIKSLINTICKCSDQYKQIFFITKNSIFRARLHRWTQYIHYLIQQKEWIQALKISIQIYNGRLDIFAQRVTITANTQLLFSEMVLVYVKSRLNEYFKKSQQNQKNTDQIDQTLETAIQFCLELEFYECFSKGLYNMLIKQYDMQQKYIKCLEIFIKNNKIKHIRNIPFFKNIIQYYAKVNLELVDKFILSLNIDSIDYGSAIQICTNHKLFNSLIYVSSLNSDFITPANKLLTVCENLKNQGYSDDKLIEYSELLYKYIKNIIQGKNINEKKLSLQIQKLGINKLLNWYLIDENAIWLIKFDCSKYFSLLSFIMTQDQVISLVNEIKAEINIQEMILENLKKTLQNLNQKKFLQYFSQCLISINKNFDFTSQICLFCLKNLRKDIDYDRLNQFITKNYKILKQSENWEQIFTGFPSQIQAWIYIRQQKYKESLKIYAHSRHQDQKKRLFKKMNNTFFHQCLEQLIRIDVDLASQYLFFYSGITINQQVQRIKSQPLKYLFIRRTLRNDINKSIEWSKNILLFYLQALCKFRNERRVSHEIKQNRFPIDQTLQIVKKYKLLSPQAYLYEIMGQYQISFSLYQQIYLNLFEDLYNKLINQQYANCRYLKYIYLSMLRVLKSKSATSKQWFVLLNTIFNPLTQTAEYESQKYADKIQQHYKKIGNQKNPFFIAVLYIMESVLLEVSSHTSIQDLNQEIKQYISIMDLKFVIDSFRSTLLTYGRECLIYQISRKLMLNDMVQTFQNILDENTIGISNEPLCFICLSSLQGQKSKIYKCGHSFHIRCIIDKQSQQNCYQCKKIKGQHGIINNQNTQLKNLNKLDQIPQRKDTRQSFVDISNQKQNVISFLAFDQNIKDEQNAFDIFESTYDSYLQQ